MEIEMDKEVVVEQLDDITTNVAQDIINTFRYKEYIIVKNASGTYTLFYQDEELYIDLYLFSVAFSLAKCLDEDSKSEINLLLKLEANYAKYTNDMYAYKNAKKWELYDTAKKNAGDFLIKIHELTKLKIYSK